MRFIHERSIHEEAMPADRGSNYHHPGYQHGGNEADPGESPEINLESGEAEEGGRDDGHFYRELTADEGTGGAGESY
jgi:hypothetical protein